MSLVFKNELLGKVSKNMFDIKHGIFTIRFSEKQDVSQDTYYTLTKLYSVFGEDVSSIIFAFHKPVIYKYSTDTWKNTVASTKYARAIGRSLQILGNLFPVCVDRLKGYDKYDAYRIGEYDNNNGMTLSDLDRSYSEYNDESDEHSEISEYEYYSDVDPEELLALEDYEDLTSSDSGWSPMFLAGYEGSDDDAVDAVAKEIRN